MLAHVLRQRLRVGGLSMADVERLAVPVAAQWLRCTMRADERRVIGGTTRRMEAA